MVYVRVGFVIGYVSVAAVACLDARATAWFWTMLMPLLPALVIVVGLRRWRQLCPVASLATLGARRYRGRRRGARTWERSKLWLPFVLLVVALWGRLVWFNSSAPLLAVLLVGFAVAALLVNQRFGGRSWCHKVCPVGFVERVYTDAVSRRKPEASCRPCSGCTSACPDISQWRAYQHELDSRARRWTSYAFVGLVLGFYGAFYVVGGTWAAFFEGGWTTEALWTSSIAGPALLVLCAGMLASLVLFLGLERLLSKRLEAPRVAFHVSVSLSAFAACSLFYVFAGAPAVRELPFAPVLRAGLGICLASYVVYRRLRPAPGEASALLENTKLVRLPVVRS